MAERFIAAKRLEMSYSNTRLVPPFHRSPSSVAIRAVSSYEADVEAILWETLKELEPPVRAKSVLIKPNFVEPNLEGTINTHPVVIRAAREAFLRMGAKSVVIAEGPGHERDTEGILEVLRVRDYLGPLERRFVDLNTDEVSQVSTRTHASKLKSLCLPKTVLAADFVVSMPKMKTHHWVGVTLSLKNMFGIVPGNCYGWPKNVLHWAGISKSILDINSTVRPDFAIVDGILGMEGNGPIQGTPKACGVLVAGDDAVAVDATCARIMGLVPARIDYLKRASLLLGNMDEERIEQLGETISSTRKPFEMLPAFQSLRA
ncbi:MAG: DUF362 domain-containing protein [Acidobacteria bacterium]|nr:MAG: DUF362 domain-containing protein [Acidobacteriota bacterium]